jgi:hypothetical protein
LRREEESFGKKYGCFRQRREEVEVVRMQRRGQKRARNKVKARKRDKGSSMDAFGVGGEEGERWNSEAECFSRTRVGGRSKELDGTVKQNALAEHD